MESSECPKAMTKAITGIDGQNVPLNQPSAVGPNCRLRGSGAGGKETWPRRMIVSGHQMRNANTMMVVICMMRSALPLDSWMPLMFIRQKYSVTIAAKKAAK